MKLYLTTAVACMAAALQLAGCATPTHVDVPAALDPGPGEKLLMTVAARGVQVYECRVRGTDASAEPEWVFVAPEAELLDLQGRVIGRHGAGPYWEAMDGSRITGTVKARADAPEAGAIPWLLLAARPSGPQGRFSRVSSVQRIHTLGGVAPTGGCHRGTTGTPARVAYAADYRLFTNVQ